MAQLPNPIAGPTGRLRSAALNALEVLRFGGLETSDAPSPFEVVAERGTYRLRHYFPGTASPGDRPAMLLVPPLMLSAEVYDVSSETSGVASLHEHGVDPWVVDFGAPEREEGGLERNLTDHVLAVADAVERVGEATGSDVHLAGYSQGGMFCYQAGAYRRCEGIASILAFGSPVDIRAAAPLGLPAPIVGPGASFLAEHVIGRRAIPAWVSRTGFRLLDPAKTLRQQLSFIRSLHDREALLPRERQRRFLEREGWVAWPGPAMVEFINQFVAHDRLLRGGFVIDERLVTLADIECPVLLFVGEVDDIAPPPAVRAIVRAAPRAEVHQVSLSAGHFGLVVGSAARETAWPMAARWAVARERGGRLPSEIEPLEAEDDEAAGGRRGPGVAYGLELLAGAGVDIARSTVGRAARTVDTARALTAAATSQLPRLTRLEGVEPQTRISLGLLLDEQARREPNGINFLWENRAHTHEAVGSRVDAVVRGLISVGVHQGEHVGVLMATRPSALTVVAALNRLGAVAVIMRPDGPSVLEARLGQVSRVVADPDHAEQAVEGTGLPVLVLGGGGEPRDLGIEGAIDMERIDPDAVEVPGWYRPNPGRATDVAFVLFTGEGERTRRKAITNGRWVLSAFGTATSAALTSSDTVFSVTPIHHPSGLLMSIGGAIAGGSRLAVASDFEPEALWDEVRRYGATVVSYTWTQLRDIVEAPPHPTESHHPIRLFIGSGMPRGLWRRVEERFAPARVLEFYASTEGDAVLVNLTGEKAGCKGRPLPGSTEVRLAAYDHEAGRLIEDGRGFARECTTDEVGMLLARVRPEMISTSEVPLRSVFERDDAWLVTGDLFRRDADGDHWMVDHAQALIPTSRGPCASFPIADALGDLPAVDLCVVHGTDAPEPGRQLAVAAVTLREGGELDADDLDRALGGLVPWHRPDVVRIVDRIPVTTWYRPSTRELAREPLPEVTEPGRMWRLDEGTERYRDVAAAAKVKETA